MEELYIRVCVDGPSPGVVHDDCPMRHAGRNGMPMAGSVGSAPVHTIKRPGAGCRAETVTSAISVSAIHLLTGPGSVSSAASGNPMSAESAIKREVAHARPCAEMRALRP